MRFLKALWSYLKRFFGAVGSLFSSITSFFTELIRTALEGPLAAFERLVERIRELLAQLLRWLRRLWLNIWQRIPRSPKDPRPTPGRPVLPLIAGTVSTCLWYLFPLADLLDLSRSRFHLALLITWLAAFLVFRRLLRADPPGRVSRWLIESHQRTGLAWFERIAFLGFGVAWWMTRGRAQASPALAMLAFGFLALLASSYRARELSDDLPDLPLLAPEPGGEDGTGPDEVPPDGAPPEMVLRSFHWAVPRGADSQPIDITVAIDPELREVMGSRNPKRPTGGEHPDWTPWVVDGTTPDVARAAREIRKLSQSHGFSRFDEAASVLGFAQSIDYVADMETTGEPEYWRYPIETMHDQVGDCEDSSILAAAVLLKLGHNVLPLVTHDHAAIAVEAPEGLPGTFFEHGGRRYYYCETTNAGFRIGERPSGVKVKGIRVCPLHIPDDAP